MRYLIFVSIFCFLGCNQAPSKDLLTLNTQPHNESPTHWIYQNKKIHISSISWRFVSSTKKSKTELYTIRGAAKYHIHNPFDQTLSVQLVFDFYDSLGFKIAATPPISGRVFHTINPLSSQQNSEDFRFEISSLKTANTIQRMGFRATFTLN